MTNELIGEVLGTALLVLLGQISQMSAMATETSSEHPWPPCYYERDGDESFLRAALRWHDYLEREIGYQEHPAGLCVNYFQKPRGMVPNNTCEWIWVLGRFASATGDSRFLEKVPAMLGFLEAVMEPTGELPYELPSVHENRLQQHYLCYQYNAFQCMKQRSQRTFPFFQQIQHRAPRRTRPQSGQTGERLSKSFYFG